MDEDALSIVDAVESDTMLVSWDVGRRCNYDCTYCPAHRHDNVSPHASMEELQNSAKFVFEYLSIMMPYKAKKRVSISFTGGEPTANPNFIAFGKWLRDEHNSKYKDLYYLNLSLTTNGAMGRKMCDSLIQNYQFSTISYHCEAKPKIKQQAINNMLYLHKAGFGVKVNVMFHAQEDYFEECKQLCLLLAKNGVDFVPRMIGEYNDNNRYHHRYSPEQLGWMKDFWDNHKKTLAKPVPKAQAPEQFHEDETEETPEGKIAQRVEVKVVAAPKPEEACTGPVESKGNARDLGRPCCGKRALNVCSSSTGQWQKTSFLTYTKFEDWFCTVNWFFLHIEQQTGDIFHHQTCKANFGKKREAIGNLSNTAAITDQLRRNIEAKTMPVIVCPNKICGCGLCLPKAGKLEDFKAIIPRHIDMEIFKNNPLIAGTVASTSFGS